MMAGFTLKPTKTLIVDVKLAAARWGRGYVSDLWEESHLKGHSADISVVKQCGVLTDSHVAVSL